MKNLVLIPCWQRDDFLSVTLDCILNANGADKNRYIFLLDRGFNGEIVTIANKFPLEKTIKYAPFHRFRGNSYNLLEGYKYALNLSKPETLIYLIEEDIWIGKDFFDCHESVQNNYDAFCVSACRNQNISEYKPFDPNKIYMHSSFQSLGISWKAKQLQYVVPHANTVYYRTPLRWFQMQFPKSIKQSCHTEQDGLIFRIMEKNNFNSIYFNVPRCFHAGFVGYNRKGKKLEGSLEERVKVLKELNDEGMNNLALEYKDIKSVPLNMDYQIKDFVLETYVETK
jgi:hypothetical protein